MQLVYTTAWTREKIKTEAMYTEWLKSLKNGDHVLRQKFCPGAGSVLDFPIERWEFQRVRIWENSLNGKGDSYPIDRASGKCKYWNSDEDWRNVFPARIVPLDNDLPTTEEGDRIYGHAPVYEPLFFEALRWVFLVEYGKLYNRGCSELRRTFPYSYNIEVCNGALFHCFVEDEIESSEFDRLDKFGVRVLYSQSCRG